MTAAGATATPLPVPATAAGALGLYPASAFRLATGTCRDCPTIPQALWYFRAETIAVPAPGLPVASFAAGVHAFDDVRQWAATRAADAPLDYPPLVWVAAPDVVRHARLADDRRSLVTPDGALPFEPTPKIPLNRSYFDASSLAFFAQRTVTVRGTPAGATFVARAFWPEDFRVGGGAPPARALPDAASPARSLRTLMREAPQGGAPEPVRRGHVVAARCRARAVGGAAGARADGQRRAGRRRRGARRALRARHRPRAGGRRDRRLARQQLLLARRRERERDSRGAGAARQLPGRPQQRTGLVPARRTCWSRCCATSAPPCSCSRR